MDKPVYVKMTFSHRTFTTAKIAIVSVAAYSEYLTTYEMLAKEKISKKIGIPVNDLAFFDTNILGPDVMFID